jgi:hypothetical protein
MPPGEEIESFQLASGLFGGQEELSFGFPRCEEEMKIGFNEEYCLR